MKMLEAYYITLQVLKEQLKQYPNRMVKTSEGVSVSLQKVVRAMNRQAQWVYPELSTSDIAKVVRCKNCIHYKKYRRKGWGQSAAIYACSLDMKQRDPLFFCKDGEEA